MTQTRTPAKLNLALVVGARRHDGKHEVATILQAIDLCDDVSIEPAGELSVDGFADDTLVRDALVALAREAGVGPAWGVRIEKRIPVAAGLGGGSSNAAAALRLANATLAQPLAPDDLHAIASRLGSDVPFFLANGAQLATGDGTELVPVSLPTDYVVLVVLPEDERKESTASVYASFDERKGERGFEGRRDEFFRLLQSVERAHDLAALPSNDLASSALSAELIRLGAFRADVTGAGPAVYGLFEDEPVARRAAGSLRRVGPSWLARPVA
jgi:4-diphosphocytidyl-2-C-methyl-D-erythritol kinase